MKKILIALVALTLFAACGQSKKVTVVNNTGVDFTAIYASLPTSDEWGTARSGAVDNNASEEISLYDFVEGQCSWDIGGETADGNYYSQREVNICEETTVTLVPGDLD